MAKVWIGSPPKACELCSKPIRDVFSDAKLPKRNGVWAIVGVCCADAEYVTYGVGRGQRYRRNETGAFVKVEG